MTPTTRPEERGLVWIGGFKLLMGLLLTAAATGVLAFVHRDVAGIIEHWVDALHLDREGQYVSALLANLDLIQDRHLRQLSGVGFVYAALLLTEGVGLMMRKKWAEWLTVIATGALIPVEINEVILRFGFWKLLLLILNIAIVWFLIWLLKRQHAKAASLHQE